MQAVNEINMFRLSKGATFAPKSLLHIKPRYAPKPETYVAVYT
jgi:hypothetical protein